MLVASEECNVALMPINIDQTYVLGFCTPILAATATHTHTHHQHCFELLNKGLFALLR